MLTREEKLQRAFSPLDALIRPEQTALLVIDMQNNSCHPRGGYACIGVDVGMNRGIILPIRMLIEEARTVGAMVLWFRMTALPDGLSDSPAYPLRRVAKYLAEKAEAHEWPRSEQGSWEWQITDELPPLPRELIIDKVRASGFVGTCTDIVLRANNILSLIVVGTATDGCVLSTAWDGLQRGYYTVIPEDCVADHNPEKHGIGVGFMRTRMDMTTSQEVIRIWRGAARPARRGCG